jgi:hypothetical protein
MDISSKIHTDGPFWKRKWWQECNERFWKKGQRKGGRARKRIT